MDKKNKIAVLLVGEAATGKTSLISRYITNTFLQNTAATIGIDYRTKKTKYKGTDVKLEIWDTAGQEKYQALPSTFYARADAIAIVFSLTEMMTFEKVESWLESILNFKSAEMVTIAIIGNKKDLTDEIVVKENQINQLCESKGIQYFPASAKTGEGVNEIFNYFTEKVCERKNIMGVDDGNSNFTINGKKNDKDKKKKCC